ncbi:hypothetical protein [Peribacillus deserti]|uniref:Membrane-spanning protein n=1 Tax=Peribacillus deserti TaxID=673318 RepID=A0A2N5M816_9BACI|nr:hypothetical protein [Peribacillus deserti]PLT30514.1 hypothetical protein CUU66_07595 [Peribacillus deserti]
MSRKLIITASMIYVLFMAVLCLYFYSSGQQFRASVAIGGIVCGAVPLLLALFTKLTFNVPLTFSYLIFLVASQYLGSIRGWYGLGWWDTFLHALSGALLGFTSIALYERLAYRSAGRGISPWFVFLFTFSFAVLGGVLWEFYEFASDQFFNMTLQGGGNKDTMTDLISDSLGGLAVAVWAGMRTGFKQRNDHT